MEHIEIEFKYDVEKLEISRKDFNKFAKKLKPVKELFLKPAKNADDLVGSYDHYFSRGNLFMRFRVGGGYWELTTKVQLEKKNNNKRIEVNIDLNHKTMNLSKATAFASVFGLEPDFSITKDVQVYWYDQVVLSHYTCEDPNGNLLNTFMEIEANEEYLWENEEQAMNVIIEWEKKFSEFGLSHRNRINKSLFQIYTKGQHEDPSMSHIVANSSKLDKILNILEDKVSKDNENNTSKG